MDDKKRMYRKIGRLQELIDMKSPDDACWSIVNNYRTNADTFTQRLENLMHFGERRFKNANGHKGSLRELLDLLKCLLNDAEAMQDDAEASHDFMERSDTKQQ